MPPTGKLSRALEKTAFVRSLRIVASELTALRSHSASASKASLAAEYQAQLPDAYQAIARLIADQTGTSTLNNPALFADIAPATLIAVAQQLTAYRTQIAQAITKSVAEILGAYRAALIAPSATTAGPSAAGASKPPKGTTGQKTKTANGLPTITTVAPLAEAKASAPATTKSAGAKRKLDLRGQSVSVTIDETRPLPEAFSSSLTAEAVASYQPSNAAAIARAEKAHPRLFSLREYLASGSRVRFRPVRDPRRAELKIRNRGGAVTHRRERQTVSDPCHLS